ncbi:helix-turn-helix transcriptional regulator [Rhodococcus opacus]|nr:helix-turn-helix transcriptional regulator [Rhodococcus opacus]
MRSQDMGSRILRSAWGLDPPTTRGPKARSSVDDIVAAAMSLADADDLTVVSLAAVAAELGLTTTALYRYIDSKDTLVEIMIDTAVGPAPSSARATGAPES